MGSTYVVAIEVVHRGLCEHRVVLELGLAQGRAVGRDEDQLGLARAEGLHGRLVAHGDWVQLAMSDSRYELDGTYPCPTS